MENRGREYLGMICNVYLAVVFAVVPLYMKEGYWKIGDAKYGLYRDISLLCFAISIPIAGLIGIYAFKKRQRFSWMDIAVLAYAAVNILSFWRSSYQDTAWNGYTEWYMGLITQLFMVSGYFLISRYYNGSNLPIWCGQAALLIIAVIAILNRLKIDPFGWFQGWTSLDWEYNHMLSTIGNINWLCGYLCIAVPLAVIGYLRGADFQKKEQQEDSSEKLEKKIQGSLEEEKEIEKNETKEYKNKHGNRWKNKNKWIEVFLYLTAVSGVLLLFIQGSDSGLAVFAVGGVLYIAFACMHREYVKKLMRLLIGLMIAFLAMGLGIRLRNSQYAFPYEDKSRMFLSWWWLWIPLLILFFWCYRNFDRLLKKKQEEKLQKAVPLLLCYGIGLLGSAAAVVLLMTWNRDIAWGSGRGGLWALALDSFKQGDIWQKLFGVGPDCYAEYVYSHFSVKEYLVQQGHWKYAVFTNAHNEWLTQLTNIGLIGMAAYASIFLTGFFRFGKRCRKDSYFCLAVLALAMYITNSFFSFQQVLNTPFLFLVLGICENRCRQSAEKREIISEE